MSFSEKSCLVFEQATKAYHITDHIDATVHNPYEVKSIEFYLYLKNWIDAVQWHMEDIIRNPAIEPTEGLVIKRRIDKSNQDRTDLVELIDSFFLDQYKNVKVLPNATINTESPAWAIDRLSHLDPEDLSYATGGRSFGCDSSIRENVKKNCAYFWNKKRIYAWHWISYWQISVLDVNI